MFVYMEAIINIYAKFLVCLFCMHYEENFCSLEDLYQHDKEATATKNVDLID